MSSKEQAKHECESYIKIREEFFDLFDTQVPKNAQGIFDFDGATLDAQEVYALFYRLDYQARKLRGLVVEAHKLKAE